MLTNAGGPVLALRDVLTARLPAHARVNDGRRRAVGSCYAARADLDSIRIRLRREWDSNPRAPRGACGFQDRRVQPLRHLSAVESALCTTPARPLALLSVDVPRHMPSNHLCRPVGQ